MSYLNIMKNVIPTDIQMMSNLSLFLQVQICFMVLIQFILTFMTNV
jgi:hypothetical protein